MSTARRRSPATTVIAENESGRRLREAAAAGRRDEIAELLSVGADPSEPEPETGDTALHLALANGHEDCAWLLLEAGAPVHQAAADGSTPAALASRVLGLDHAFVKRISAGAG